MDMEFNKVIPEMPQFNINTTAASENVAEIKRRIRIIKERCRTTLSTLPFKKLPNVMTINLFQFSVFWLNAMPVMHISNIQPKRIDVLSKSGCKEMVQVVVW